MMDYYQRQMEYCLLNLELPIKRFRQYAYFIEKSFQEESVALKEENTFADDSLLGRLKQTDIYLYDVQFPTILRSSLLISVDSFLEKTLVSLCIPGESGIPFTPFEDPKDKRSIISKAMSYLEAESDLKFSCTKSWDYIRDAHKIRNCFVHDGGNVMMSDRKNQLLKIIKKREYIRKNRGHNLILDKEFCLELIDVIEKLFVDLSKDQDGNFYRWIPVH